MVLGVELRLFILHLSSVFLQADCQDFGAKGYLNIWTNLASAGPYPRLQVPAGMSMFGGLVQNDLEML